LIAAFLPPPLPLTLLIFLIMAGTILFNFGFVTTVPSWVNEKKPHVSVNKTVWISTFCCNLVFFAIGKPDA
jgi:hypothetical protein